ncbi:hypothetical protein [Saccharothrix syringae]|uniref:Uncharacterized protein n=1 Tax=Saccharothrix syringae TaxID=103733 RepID=A0A5Q0GU68_SACSY|nr:hypothetical protein [Saccharothrix syringae]QFZ17040.1 hypothetical protein EKG83_05755 [Saccharothrix syringae]
MNVLASLAQTTLAQTADTTEGAPVVVMIMMGAMALVLGLARLLRRLLGMLTRVLVSAGAAMTGIATMIALCAVLTTVLMVYVR